MKTQKELHDLITSRYAKYLDLPAELFENRSEEDKKYLFYIAEGLTVMLGRNKENHRRWIRAKNKGLNGEEPIKLLETTEGLKEIWFYLSFFLDGH